MTDFQALAPNPEPGPYSVTFYNDGQESCLRMYSKTTGCVIAEHRFHNRFDPHENARLESTYRLIASTPDLKAALVNLLLSLKDFDTPRLVAEAIAEARYVLAICDGPKFTSKTSFLIPTECDGE